MQGSADEFLAYRILYNIFTENILEINTVLAELDEGGVRSPAVEHALAVSQAQRLGNYHKFFTLLRVSPKRKPNRP